MPRAGPKVHFGQQFLPLARTPDVRRCASKPQDAWKEDVTHSGVVHLRRRAVRGVQDVN